ncbi:MAG: IS21-like element helper ATPase IstB [Chitinispirillaceae bacterium]|nr:IS21-like element helper ATPase IstB [Chitinispirillaceae bacterium]
MNAHEIKHTPDDERRLREHLQSLKLTAFLDNYSTAAQQAGEKQWGYTHFLGQLAEAEVNARNDRCVQRRIKLARFPVVKTLDNFDWDWPKKINRLQVQQLFALSFIKDCANVIFLAGVGLGKTHLSTALAYQACLKGYTVLFASAIDIVNTLSAACTTGRLKTELKKYLKPDILVMDELGYLPVDKKGADLLFQVISQRYEHGPIILTTNKQFKKWPEIFSNDSTLTSAVLDRLLHHAETIVIEGKSYRMKDTIEE